MDFTPIIPTEQDGKIKEELLLLSEKIVIKSAKITGTHNTIVLRSIKKMLRNVNSYYSNKIEAEGTHPIDIEKAMRKEYSKNEKEKRLQQLSIAYIDTQMLIENKINKGELPINKNFIKEIHEFFYTQEGMESFCDIQNKTNIIKMKPGGIRTHDVEVGSHIAPKHDDVEHLLNMYETLYRLPQYKTKTEKLIHVFASHHRLVWIHPFLDGNGRVSRLILDGFLQSINIDGYGLWNISRGLARNLDNYQHTLACADETRESDRQRGYLSNSQLEKFVKFMLVTALDQITYMSSCLQLNSLSSRIENFCRESYLGFLEIPPLPQGSELIFKELLIHGEIERGKVQNIINKKKTVTAAVIKELIERYFIESDGPRKPLRLKFNSYFASKIFPDLVPSNKISL
ncbi:MAG: cell filamentation protein Fic [Arcobacter sp.]|nr:cell filamentation protein Fic [Arcobacter sp.]